MLLKYYLEQLDYNDMPLFLKKYLKCPSLVRLMSVGYFCGMDFASKSVYNFDEYISRFDHSLTTSLLTYKVTNDKTMTVAALFHDVATPCFSHVIDYMNEDYEKQESTEELTEDIIKNDKYLLKCLKEDNIDLVDLDDFSRFQILENKSPKLCTDRLDGVLHTCYIWLHTHSLEQIKEIYNNMVILKNEDGNLEIGFCDLKIAEKFVCMVYNYAKELHRNTDKRLRC